MGTGDPGILSFCFAQSAAHHLVGYGIGKQHKQIGRTDVFQSACHLGIDLRFTFILAAKLLVLADHTFIAAYDHHAHFYTSFYNQLAVANSTLKTFIPSSCKKNYIKNKEPYPLQKGRIRLHSGGDSITASPVRPLAAVIPFLLKNLAVCHANHAVRRSRLLLTDYCAFVFCARYSTGDTPLTERKAFANLLELSYPCSFAISVTVLSVYSSIYAADSIFCVFMYA